MADDLSGSASTRAALNRQMAGIGTVTELAIDRQTRSIHAVVELAGEDKPLVVDIGNYRLQEDDGALAMACTGVTTSRPWLTALAQNLLTGQRLTIPPKYAAVVRGLLE